jgi:aerobic carbon-monoxide dehydrogenase medium subunit
MTEPLYLRAASVDDAIAALSSAGTDGLVIAGGVVVASLFNQRLASPSVLVDISRIASLHRLERLANGDLLIGAMVTHEEVLRAPLVKATAPLLSEIAKDISCARLRNRGTIGGSVCTIGGQGDPATGLIALGADLHLRGPQGERVLKIEDFYTDAFEVDLQGGEILETIRVPAQPPGTVSAFCKIGPRNAMDWTQITVSVAGQRSAGGDIEQIRIGMNGVATTPSRPRSTEAMLRGTPDQIAWPAVAAALAAEVSPQPDLIYSVEYKLHIAGVALRRAVESAWNPVSREKA